ncbi:hypothetical protein UPYG_G00267810 [Umbra pygmaea]|uniref:Uncharacterized protein n=1 Tax=Umbra pygmaea TaxID=75934 RepID=A0ABD0WA92_UMBPY
MFTLSVAVTLNVTTLYICLIDQFLVDCQQPAAPASVSPPSSPQLRQARAFLTCSQSPKIVPALQEDGTPSLSSRDSLDPSLAWPGSLIHQVLRSPESAYPPDTSCTVDCWALHPGQLEMCCSSLVELDIITSCPGGSRLQCKHMAYCR